LRKPTRRLGFLRYETQHMTTEIRAAILSDLPDLMRLICAKAAFDNATDALRIDEARLRAALFGAPAKLRALVAVVDGTVAGVATYYDIYSSFLGRPGLWLDDLYIDEPHRSRGIGKQLIVFLCREAHKNGCARIDWLVAADNSRGQAFYKSLGADISHTTHHVRLNADAIHALTR
jgi:GNAT superfamily N-acetyltransferase